MSKDDIIKYAALAFGIVLAGRFFADAVFAWIGDILFKKSSDEKNLEDLIRSKKYTMGSLSESEQLRINSPLEKEAKTKPPLQIDHEISPLELRKREIMHRIYDLELRKLNGETVEAYNLRLIGLTKLESHDQLKKAYKVLAKKFHPDMFALGDFDPKAKRKLEARIHENYVAIQKAHDFLKKSLK